jgi:hypothetical protein
MTAPSAADLLAVWDPTSRASPHQRLSDLLAHERAELLAADTLGTRNQRLLRLHRMLVAGVLEARVACAHCAVESEFELPVDGILAVPHPAADAAVRIRSGGRTAAFRIPRMGDIEASPAAGLRRAVIERCRIGRGPPVSDEAIARLGRKFEALDPAANIVVNIACSGCARPIAASVDVASFVARDLDRIHEALLRDIDVIASVYGWSESEIVALPPERRRRYVMMIAARRAPSRPSLVRQ